MVDVGMDPNASTEWATVTAIVWTEAPAGDGPAIKQVSELLGVPAPTLRSWERRYGIPMTSRSAGGHRRYAEDELNQIRLMRDEIARGKRAAEAALAVRLLLDQANPGHRRINQILVGAEQRDSKTIRALLDDARESMSLGAAIDEVLMPALRQIGAWWEIGRCDVPQERILTETSRGWLAQLTAFMPLDTYEPPILLACGPRDMHTVGLEALAALLAEQRRGSRVLGAQTSELTLVTATRATAAAAVVVVSQLRTHRRVAVESLRAADATGTPVFYAGNAFAFEGDRRDVPGTYLSDTFSVATRTILNSLHASTPHMPQHVA